LEYSLHHFVPQFYLRRFTDSDGLLWVYDKDSDRVFSATPRNLATERGFYTLPDFFPDPSLLERQFSDLEEQAALITQYWLNEMKTGHSVEIPGVNREIISLYLTTQLLRTSEARTLLLQGIKSGEGETKRELHSALLWNSEVVKEISDWVYSCIWTFRFNSMPQSLYTSDDPVKVRTSTRHLHWAQASVRGAYLLIPMTPRILMYCFEPKYWKTLKQLDCEVSPKPLELELVNDANIQQVGHARRFVFSDRNDFSSAQEFCHENPGAVGENRGRFVQ
jgi:hypothetical protein